MPAIVFGNATKPSRFAHFWQCAQSLAPATQNDASTSKVARTCGALTFWLRNVLRATAACTFFDISTSKSAPKLVCFVHLASKCASRHNRVHFFDISTSKSGRGWCGFYSLTWKCASRHNGGQLLISHLTTWLCTRRYSEPTFRPSGATNHWKNRMFRDFPTFSGTWIFFLRKLSLFDLLSSSLLFSDSSHLCFSSFHIVGSLTSKLHSINYRVKPSNGTFMFTLFSKGSQLKSQMCQLQISQNWQRTQNLNMWGTLSSRGKGLISMYLLDNPKFPNIQQLFSIAFPKFRYLHQDMTWNISCQKKQPTISLRVWGGWTHLKHHKLTIIFSWLVVCLPDIPLWKIWKSAGIILSNIWKNKKCSKPPTSHYIQYIVSNPAEWNLRQKVNGQVNVSPVLVSWSSRFPKTNGIVPIILKVITQHLSFAHSVWSVQFLFG